MIVKTLHKSQYLSISAQSSLRGTLFKKINLLYSFSLFHDTIAL